MPSSITYKQSNQIFEILQWKAEEERVAATEKAALEKELMRKESDARIAAATAATVAAVITAAGANVGAPAPKKVVREEDDIIGEVPPEVKNIFLRFVGLP